MRRQIEKYWRRVGARSLISRGGRTFRIAVCSILVARGVHPLSGPLIVNFDVFPSTEDSAFGPLAAVIKELNQRCREFTFVHNSFQSKCNGGVSCLVWIRSAVSRPLRTVFPIR